MSWHVRGKIGLASIYPVEDGDFSAYDCAFDFSFIGGAPPTQAIRDAKCAFGVYRVGKVKDVLSGFGERGRKFVGPVDEERTSFVWFYDDEESGEKSCNFFLGIEDHDWSAVSASLSQAMANNYEFRFYGSGHFSVEDNPNEDRSPTPSEFEQGYVMHLFDPVLRIITPGMLSS